MRNKKRQTSIKSKVTRRDFLKGSAVGIGTAAFTGLNPKKAHADSTSNIPKKWDNEADVVVLGTGLAGLATAIQAHDDGAKVIILEKMAKEFEGGNSKVSGNMWWSPENVPDGITHIKALCYGTTDEASIIALANELAKNNDWIKKLGGDPVDISATFPAISPEWPGLPGSKCVHTYAINGRLGGGYLWQLFRDNVKKRGIEVVYEVPAQELVQLYETREVVGVVAKKGGKEVTIKARKGLVLACGGFEFDFEMQKQFQPGWPIYSLGTPGNTGDGIKMAMKAGADLWHMCNPMGGAPWCILVPEYDPIPMTIFSMPGMSFIWVDKEGKRFMNELTEGRHGFGHRETVLDFLPQKHDHFRIPCYAVFDEVLRKKGPLITTHKFSWFNWHSGYTWTKDNSAEIEKGWIIKADSIEGLAEKIGVDAATFKETIGMYNKSCEIGEDREFGRPSEARPFLLAPAIPSLKPILEPPFYAVMVWPGMVNTQGGPKRNKHCQVLDPSNSPIPRLYSAGECGSFWGWMYNAGGNIAECMATGRIAGKKTAAEKPWVNREG